MQEKKARDLVLLETGKISIVADYFLIGTGNSRIQIRAICDHLRQQLKESGFLPLRIEGYGEGYWVLMDYGGLVIHLLQQEARDFYDLERLWDRAPVVEKL
ncbi:MAG: ribosome silencing factor [Firmicutes bacterium]|nr:ribosome silencing factor [Bacillota bacterium]